MFSWKTIIVINNWKVVVAVIRPSTMWWCPFQFFFSFAQLYMVMHCTFNCHDFVRLRDIKMTSIIVDTKFHWFLWSPRCVKLVYHRTILTVVRTERAIFKLFNNLRRKIKLRSLDKFFQAITSDMKKVPLLKSDSARPDSTPTFYRNSVDTEPSDV